MRPRSEVRQALVQAYAEHGAMSWRDALAHAPVNPFSPAEARLVQHTVENMARSGELAAFDTVRLPGARRPLTRYAAPPPDANCAALERAVKSWADFR